MIFLILVLELLIYSVCTKSYWKSMEKKYGLSLKKKYTHLNIFITILFIWKAGISQKS